MFGDYFIVGIILLYIVTLFFATLIQRRLEDSTCLPHFTPKLILWYYFISVCEKIEVRPAVGW